MTAMDATTSSSNDTVASLREKAAQHMPCVLLESSQRTPGAKSLLFTNPVAILEPRTPQALHEALRRIEEETARGRWVAGYVAYEAGFALEPKLLPLLPSEGERLAWLGIFADCEQHEPADDARDESWATAAEPIACSPLHPSVTADEYASQVRQVHAWIAAGDSYQANLTMPVQFDVRGEAEAFAAAMAAQPVDFGAWLRLGDGEAIVSASPELFFQRSDRSILTRPMKGTAPRGRWLQEDQERAAALALDAKNRAENVMIVDLLRNDLGRVCEPGSIQAERLFHVETLPTLLQMTSEVRGTLRDGVGTAEIFQALFPSGSIVGAPKLRTLQLLHGLEGRARGVYTGAIGYQGPGGEAAWSVAIRTMHLHGNRATMGVGSGIVADSDAAGEFAECQAKAAFVTRQNTDFQLIETLLWHDGYTLIDEHLKRLGESAAYFRFRFDRDEVLASLRYAARPLPAGIRHRVRLLLHRDGHVQVASTMLPEEPTGPFRLLVLKQPVHSQDVFLFHKTTRRQVYDDAHRRATERGCLDALLLNERGEVTEGGIYNVFCKLDGEMVTPPVACGVLPGVFRETWLRNGTAREQVLRLEDVLRADEVWATNSVRGPKRIDGFVHEPLSAEV